MTGPNSSSSVSGDLAEEALESLVGQFDDPYVFVRELIQNSLDAGAAVIDVDMHWEAGTLTIAVVDDGEGMDRSIIEDYLLTLFRSTKERDRTRIGKFGIGFVSLFAMKPQQVVVDTGRDLVWHRVVFDAQFDYTLLHNEAPFEGTTVTLTLKRSRSQALADARAVRQRCFYWCRYAAAEIHTSLAHPEGWPLTRVEDAFTVESPVVVRRELDGFVAVLGISASDTPHVGFYNHGLTLLETEEAHVPGVTFKVASRLLEHTLTRDNVRRDGNFREVMRRVRTLARGALATAVHEALEAAARAQDVARCREIGAALHGTVPWDWEPDALLLPVVGGPGISVSQLRTLSRRRWQWWRASDALLWVSERDDRLARRVAGEQPVLLGAPGDPHVTWAASWSQARVQAVEDHWRLPEVVDAAPPLVAAVQQAADALEVRLVVVAARFSGGGATLAGRLACLQHEPGALEALDSSEEHGEHLLIDIEHPLFQKALRVPEQTAAVLVLRAALVQVGRAARLEASWVARAIGGLS